MVDENWAEYVVLLVFQVQKQAVVHQISVPKRRAMSYAE